VDGRFVGAGAEVNRRPYPADMAKSDNSIGNFNSSLKIIQLGVKAVYPRDSPYFR
jgi:hypothetical protein